MHLKVRNGKRIVGDLKRATTGKVSPEENSVKSTTDHVGTGWLKLTPTQDLAPGEYAVVEMKGDRGDEPLYLALQRQSQQPSQYKSMDAGCESKECGAHGSEVNLYWLSPELSDAHSAISPFARVTGCRWLPTSQARLE